MTLHFSVWKHLALDFWCFTKKQFQSCLFAFLFFGLLLISKLLPWQEIGIYRYDFLFVACVLAQIALFFFKLESWKDIQVIFCFHILGTILELFKTAPQIGSWQYPETAYFRIATVPLYSGFMYSTVGSYMNFAWKHFKLTFTHFPNKWLCGVLCSAIYIHFFAHHWIGDYRHYFYVALIALFWKTKVHFTPRLKSYTMPLIVSFLLIGFFVWAAENISTLLGAWQYPNQQHAWELVHPQKISSWFLLVVISFILVMNLHPESVDLLPGMRAKQN